MIAANYKKVKTYKFSVDKILSTPLVLKGVDLKKFVHRTFLAETTTIPILKKFRMSELPKYNVTSGCNKYATAYTYRISNDDTKYDKIKSVLTKKFGEMPSKGTLTWHHNLAQKFVDTSKGHTLMPSK